MEKDSYPGIYRAIVKSNFDPLNKGRVKVFVPGIYPCEFEPLSDKLPFAEPAFPIWGGNFTNVRKAEDGDLNDETGISSVPHNEAKIWVFFENMNPSFPIYFLNIQGGSGWLSEHIEQHVIKSDNVRIRVDENPGDPASTAKFDSFNKRNTSLSKERIEEDIPTRVDIEVFGNVNIQIKGSVNMKIIGNVFEEIEGDKHETIIGNRFIRHVGDLHEVHEGDKLIEHTGNVVEDDVGDEDIFRIGNRTKFIDGNENEIITNVKTLTVARQYNESIVNKNSSIQGLNSETVIGTDIKQVEGISTYQVEGNLNIGTNKGSIGDGNTDWNLDGNLIMNSKRDIRARGRKIFLN